MSAFYLFFSLVAIGSLSWAAVRFFRPPTYYGSNEGGLADLFLCGGAVVVAVLACLAMATRALFF